MEQQSEATNAPHKVIYIIQAPKEKVNIKDVYNIKAATVLGVIHIVCGFIALGSDIAGMVNGDFATAATGTWTSVLFFVSGGLAIGGARSGNKCLVVATMVMAIISSVSAGILLIMSAISLHFISYSYRYRDEMAPVSYMLLVAMGATMLIIAIASASLTCYPLCCRSTKQGAVHYNPNQVPASVFVIVKFSHFHIVTHCHIVTFSHNHNNPNQVPASIVVNADQMAGLNLPTVQDLQAYPSTSVQVNK